MLHTFFRTLFLLCIVILSACSAKTSQQVSANLWGEWETFEQQIQADYPDAVPVILIHGWNGGEFSWPDPRTLVRMEQELQRDIYLFTYRTGLVANRYPPLELLEEQLDLYLNNYKQVDVVAHSMGGLLVRQYLSHHSNNPVRRLLLLSTPNFGTDIANLLVEIGDISYTGNIQASELLPGSDFLWQLNSLEGSELDNISVLNVYARKQQKLLSGDLVVQTSHAWLPWAPNSEVDGDHHLGHRIHEPWAMAFLRNGQLPEPAPMPEGHELWLKIKFANTEQMIDFNDSAIRFHSGSKAGKEKEFSLCCDKRSGLHRFGGTSLILEGVKADDMVTYYPRNGSGTRRIALDQLLDSNRPVQLKVLTLDQPREATD